MAASTGAKYCGQAAASQGRKRKGALCCVEGCIVQAANPTHTLLFRPVIHLGFTRNERDHKRPMEAGAAIDPRGL